MASSMNQSQQQPINYSNDASATAAAATSTSSVTTKTPVAFDEDLFLFLPRLGDIFKSFEKNPNELKLKLDELRKQFEACHDMVSRVEGIDTTIDEQQSELERLDNELKCKTELLKKHIQMCKFDLNVPPKSQRITSETDEDMGNDTLQHSTSAMHTNDDDDDDYFHSDDNTHLHQESHSENLASFF